MILFKIDDLFTKDSSRSLLQRAQSGMSARPALKFKSRRGNAFRASHQVSKNSEWFKKLDPGAQFQLERISSAIQPCCSLGGSEAGPSTSSRYRSFRLHTASPGKDRPKYASPSASQWLSRSGIPRPPSCVRWMHTYLRTIGLRPPQSNLERDCSSASRCALGKGSTANR